MLCVSISEKTLQECLTVLDTLQEDELAEVRLDLILDIGQGEVSSEELTKVLEHPRKKIVTCRDLKAEKGFTEERRKCLEGAIQSGNVAMVDVEYEAPEEYATKLRDCAKLHNVQVIVSYHNYEQTPDKSMLCEIVDNCFNKLGADIAKVACLSNSFADSARILALYDDNRKIVALGMGEFGRITRVAAPSLGALFTFVAASPETATAPGQLTLAQMRSIQTTMSSH